MTGHDGRRPWLLAIDTATTEVVLATGSLDGVADGITTWQAGYRHGETLLRSIAGLRGEGNLRRSRLAGVIVGTGPGAFTGLRVGIATAKGLAYGLGIPLAGVSTAAALIHAAAEAEGVDTDRMVLVQPAGPADRVVTRRHRPPELVRGDDPVTLGAGERLVAVDLPDRAPADALARGVAARAGLGAALLRMGADAIPAATPDGLAALAPDYVTAPRGAAMSQGQVTWSRDPR